MSKEILKKYNIKAKKSLGQNFLVNDKIVEQIANIIELENKNIVEVGPWYWALTQKLLEKNPKNLSLVELDKDMIAILQDRINSWDLNLRNTDFKINNIDILKFDPEFNNYSVIANIPYYITSPILRHFLYDLKNKPEAMVILMQKDVWDKILDNKKKSVLSLMVAKKAKVSEKIFVWKQNFIPSPKVESSVLLFESHNLYDKIDDNKFLELIKKWFLSPRKKLVKNLVNSWFSKDLVVKNLEKIWVSTDSRPENLWIEDWCKLTNLLFN